MDKVDALAQLISTLGFPIVAFAAIFYLYDKTVKDLTTTIAKIDSTLSQIISRLDSDHLCHYLRSNDGD